MGVFTLGAAVAAARFAWQDMECGFVTRGMSISNPLADQLHPKLVTLLSARN